MSPRDVVCVTIGCNCMGALASAHAGYATGCFIHVICLLCGIGFMAMDVLGETAK